MQTLEVLKRKIGNAKDVQSVVSAMKVLAIVSIRQFEKSLASLNDYQRALELGLQATLKNYGGDEDESAYDPFAYLPPVQTHDGQSAVDSHEPPIENRAAAHTCAVVFGSEQGLSGQFNERIATYTLEQLRSMGIAREDRTLLALGDHVAYRLQAAREPVQKKFPMEGSVKAMRQTVQSLFLHFGEMQRRGECSQILLFHHKSLSGAHNILHTGRLFPLDMPALRQLRDREWPSRSLPTFTLDRNRLLGALIHQYIRASLEQAFVESLVSENSSRLVAMQVAESNIADFLDDLRHEFNEQRQSEITSEILDIVAGLEAMEKTGMAQL
ncbi:MAG: F0F1 ATP synthase subunit gamma [Thermoleophilia bacterium]